MPQEDSQENSWEFSPARSREKEPRSQASDRPTGALRRLWAWLALWRRRQGSKDQVVGQLVGIVQATTHDQEVAAIAAAALEPGQDSPVKEALTFGAQALRERLPVRWAQGELCDAGDRVEQAALRGLH